MMRKMTQFGRAIGACALAVSAAVLSPATPAPAQTGQWRAEYYANIDLAGYPNAVYYQDGINFDWELGSPAAGLPSDRFSIRWTRTAYFSPGTYRLRVQMDDGARVYVNNVLAIDAWTVGGYRDAQAEMYLSGAVEIRVEYFEWEGYAKIAYDEVLLSGTGDLAAWTGQYFGNKDLIGPPLFVRNDARIDFDWGDGPPVFGAPADNFSVRWTRAQRFDPDVYRITVTVDDGVRVYAGGRLVINEWNVSPPRTRTADVTLSGLVELRVEFFEAGGGALVKLDISRVGSSGSGQGVWRAEYFNNLSLAGSPVLVAQVPAVNFDWGQGSPDARISPDNFSARFSRTQTFAPGRYRFTLRPDDGGRLYVNNRLVLDDWREGAPRDLSVALDLSGPTSLRVDYFELGGGASVRLDYALDGTQVFREWKGEYYPNLDFSGSPQIVRNDPAINFEWHQTLVAPGFPTDGFTVRWTRRQTFDTGVHRFEVTYDDGMRIYIDGALVFSDWTDGAERRAAFDVSLSGERALTVEYYERSGGAVAKLAISRVSGAAPSPVPPPSEVRATLSATMSNNQVTVTGARWTAGQLVRLSFVNARTGAATHSASALADFSGSFRTTFRVSGTLATDNYRIHATQGSTLVVADVVRVRAP